MEGPDDLTRPKQQPEDWDDVNEVSKMIAGLEDQKHKTGGLDVEPPVFRSVQADLLSGLLTPRQAMEKINTLLKDRSLR